MTLRRSGKPTVPFWLRKHRLEESRQKRWLKKCLLEFRKLTAWNNVFGRRIPATSAVVNMAQLPGIDFTELSRDLINAARQRCKAGLDKEILGWLGGCRVKGEALRVMAIIGRFSGVGTISRSQFLDGLGWSTQPTMVRSLYSTLDELEQDGYLLRVKGKQGGSAGWYCLRPLFDDLLTRANLYPSNPGSAAADDPFFDRDREECDRLLQTLTWIEATSERLKKSQTQRPIKVTPSNCLKGNPGELHSGTGGDATPGKGSRDLPAKVGADPPPKVGVRSLKGNPGEGPSLVPSEDFDFQKGLSAQVEDPSSLKDDEDDEVTADDLQKLWDELGGSS